MAVLAVAYLPIQQAAQMQEILQLTRHFCRFETALVSMLVAMKMQPEMQGISGYWQLRL
jgi:hypothetical protein